MSYFKTGHRMLLPEQIKKSKLASPNRDWLHAKIKSREQSDSGDEGGSGGSGKRFTAFSQKEFANIVDKGGFRNSPDLIAENLGYEALENPLADSPEEKQSKVQTREQLKASAQSYQNYASQDAASKISAAASKSFSSLTSVTEVQKNNPAANPKGDRNSAFLSMRATAGESVNGMRFANPHGFQAKNNAGGTASFPQKSFSFGKGNGAR